MSDKRGLGTKEMLQSMDAVKSMDPEDFHYRSGTNQIDIQGSVIEAGWEDFVPSVSVYENGELLYTLDAANVGSYHNETYTQGRFSSLEDTASYLQEKYADVTDWMPVPEAVEPIRRPYERKWTN